MIEWSQISPEQFEKLCAELIELYGFSNIEWFGKGGGDKGRDLIAFRLEEPLPGVRRQAKWLIQCKRYTRKRISKLDVEAFLVAAKEHSPDTALLIVATTLTPDVRDWLRSVRDQYRFEIILWEERDLEREIRRYRERLSIVPTLRPRSEDSVLFYPMRSYDRIYMSNEIEEVGFYVVSHSDPSDDVRRIRKFVDFLRNNEVHFQGDDNDRSRDTG